MLHVSRPFTIEGLAAIGADLLLCRFMAELEKRGLSLGAIDGLLLDQYYGLADLRYELNEVANYPNVRPKRRHQLPEFLTMAAAGCCAGIQIDDVLHG